jgi:hypothetical protein
MSLSQSIKNLIRHGPLFTLLTSTLLRAGGGGRSIRVADPS